MLYIYLDKEAIPHCMTWIIQGQMLFYKQKFSHQIHTSCWHWTVLHDVQRIVKLTLQHLGLFIFRVLTENEDLFLFFFLDP